MKNDKQLWEIVMDIYREMYSQTTPKADLSKLIKDGTTQKERWFTGYYLAEEKQDEIIEKHCKKLNKLERKKVEFGVYLGASPTFIKEEK